LLQKLKAVKKTMAKVKFILNGAETTLWDFAGHAEAM